MSATSRSCTSAPIVFVLQPFYKRLNLLFQGRKVPFHSPSHFLEIHSEILVNEYVAHGDDLCPWYLRVGLMKGFAKLCCRLTNELNVVENPHV
jgi:hypothetical protein